MYYFLAKVPAPFHAAARRNLCTIHFWLHSHFLLRSEIYKLQSGTQTTHYAAPIFSRWNNNRERQVPLALVIRKFCDWWDPHLSKWLQARMEFCQVWWRCPGSARCGENFTASLGSRVTAGVINGLFGKRKCARDLRVSLSQQKCYCVSRMKICNCKTIEEIAKWDR